MSRLVLVTVGRPHVDRRSGRRVGDLAADPTHRVARRPDGRRERRCDAVGLDVPRLDTVAEGESTPDRLATVRVGVQRLRDPGFAVLAEFETGDAGGVGSLENYVVCRFIRAGRYIVPSAPNRDFRPSDIVQRRVVLGFEFFRIGDAVAVGIRGGRVRPERVFAAVERSVADGVVAPEIGRYRSGVESSFECTVGLKCGTL